MSTEIAQTPAVWTQVSRIVFPPTGEEDTLPLYVDFGRAAPVDAPDAGGRRGAQFDIEVGAGAKLDRGDLIACLDSSAAEVARGLVNYSADEARRIMGRPSGDIEAILGYVDEPELIHRDNLVLAG